MIITYDIEQAHDRFLELCVDLERDQYEEMLQTIEDDIRMLENKLQDIANKLEKRLFISKSKEKWFKDLEKAQKLLIVKMLQRKEYQTILASFGVVAKRDYEQDFEKIIRIPQVISLGIGAYGQFVAVIQARIKHFGVVYDLGDWAIGFGYTSLPLLDDPTLDLDSALPLFTSSEVRQGRRDEWEATGRHYPSYDYGNGVFCFGSNSETIEAHIERRQFVHAIQLCAHVLCSVNDEDRHLIPDAFHVVRNRK